MESLAENIGQLMMVGFEGLRPPRHILQWLSSGRIGGVYLFARNIASPAQVKQLTEDCRAAAKNPILVGIDQEGGAVARLRDGFTESPGAMALAAGGDRHLAEDIAYMMGRELAALGINWNFAPAADIAHKRDNPSIGTRSIGRDPQLVSELVAAQIRGFQRAGVAATAKHFPGLGNTVIDTHDAPVKATGSLNDLYQEDLAPFRAAIAADVGCLMLTHVIYDELDAERPATLSPRIVCSLLRDELGFDGVVCTDCMEMKAITDAFGAGESAVLAIEAGTDLVLVFSYARGAVSGVRVCLGISTERPLVRGASRSISKANPEAQATLPARRRAVHRGCRKRCASVAGAKSRSRWYCAAEKGRGASPDR